MSDIANKVETLMEAMPYLQKYQGKIIVIKYGGNASSRTPSCTTWCCSSSSA